ncbi:zinc finger protein 438 isoform X2 [Conger conger]|uniref:zinc finger protein 438 isoform X2 n=1 Tax=Conger conger TaxID=82655 RepID=UPI002A5AA209|nr:zinc finger protein 438 isoform X2 [Conger conger]
MKKPICDPDKIPERKSAVTVLDEAMKSQEQKMNQSALKGQIQNEARPQCQTKSLQFRSIAPKALPAVSAPPAVLSCQPPSALPEASAAVSPKSIIVPAQNYALMQVAGQEGTFSLVALPPSLSPQSPQQIQKGLPIPKNLKLPIPRYQPVRSKSTPEKASPGKASRLQSPTKSPLPKRRAATAVRAQPSECLESRPTVEPPEQVIVIDPGPSEIAVTTLLADNALLCPGSQLEKPVDLDKIKGEQQNLQQNMRCSSSAGSKETLVPASLPAGDRSPAKPLEEGKRFRPCLSKPASQPSNSITVLSPAVFSKAVQIIPSPPRGKLPILPYSKMKSTLLPVAKSSPKCANLPDGPLENAEVVHQKQPRQNQALAKSGGLLGAGPSASPAGKKRGRKRKTMEDILAFEAKKKRSLSFFRRRVPEKPTPASGTTAASSTGSKDRAVDISKKYRSIRPKPVLLMETLPRLVGLPALPAPENLEQEILVGQQLPGKSPESQRLGQVTVRQGPLRVAGVGSGAELGGYAFVGSRQLHRCPTCSRCFQFKHHLQSHMNSHTNSRPYVCPMCRKTYAHSGSLSTHMKLHHAEGRPRRTLRCEFCEKAFGYVGVYFSHLKEVHKVILTVEPSISQHEEDVPVLSSAPPDVDEQEEDPVELQIKCGRCQAITPTFADMKLHLLYVHGEEVQVRLKEGALQGGREAEDELVKHAAHYWRQLNEKRNMVKCGSCEEEFFSFSKLKRHVHSHHQGEPGVAPEGGGSPASEESELSARSVLAQGFRTGSAFNCILCRDVLDGKTELLEHWRSQHNCEDPSLLWTVFTAFAENEDLQQGAIV